MILPMDQAKPENEDRCRHPQKGGHDLDLDRLVFRGRVHKRTCPYHPGTHGKAEQFRQTALRKWAYGRADKNTGKRAQHGLPLAASVQRGTAPMLASTTSPQSVGVTCQ